MPNLKSRRATGGPAMSESILPEAGRLVPLMSEIEAVPWNGFEVVSTFSGCGGSCLGFRWAGYKTLWASEFVPAAREVYALNHPGVPVDARDIREVKPEDILYATGRERGQIDVLEGSPPCASFSMAGKREETWGKVKKYSDVEQRTDDLFFEFVRILEGLQPKVFVAENVKGLLLGEARNYFKQIKAAMTAAGYLVRAQVLDAQRLGVPQHRERVIFVGVRNDIGREPVFPRHQSRLVPLKAVLPWITARGAGAGFEVKQEAWIGSDKPCGTIGNGPSSGSGHSPVGECLVGEVPPVNGPLQAAFDFGEPEPAPAALPAELGEDHARQAKEASIARYAIGEEWDKLKPGEQSEKYFSLQREDADSPRGTVQASHGALSLAGSCHPFEKRKFTIPELKRICGFPDDFVLTGTFAQQWERLGRAVPPPMMKAVAETVRDRLLIPLRDGA